MLIKNGVGRVLAANDNCNATVPHSLGVVVVVSSAGLGLKEKQLALGFRAVGRTLDVHYVNYVLPKGVLRLN